MVFCVRGGYFKIPDFESRQEKCLLQFLTVAIVSYSGSMRTQGFELRGVW